MAGKSSGRASRADDSVPSLLHANANAVLPLSDKLVFCLALGVLVSAVSLVATDRLIDRMTASGSAVLPAPYALGLLVLVAGVPLVFAVLAAIIVAVVDRTQRHRLEAQRLRAELVSVASHELRTPLTGLRWSEESLLRQQLDDKQRRSIQVMYNITLRLEDSIESMLQLAGLEAGKVPQLNLKEEDIVAMVKEVYSVQQLSADRREIKLEYDKSWPERLMLVCDARRLRRVFGNLVSNGIKYSRPQGVVRVGYEHTAEGHQFTVTDEGIGIPDKEVDKVFAGYYRASNTAAHDVSGTGMGLVLSRTIVEQHGGRMWLESQENAGTTVYVLLPDGTPAEPKSSTLTDSPPA
jgi:signal transduction histidine kinase